MSHQDDGRWRDPGRALQILSTEHWSLLSARSNTWNEAFARSALYLTVLSASVVALALVAQATGFDRRLAGVALILMSVVVFVGITTVIRLLQSGQEELIYIAGMNRIRAMYVELEPAVAEIFVSDSHDDEAGLLRSSGVPPGSRLSVVHMFVTAPGMLSIVNAVVAGATIALAVAAVGAPVWVAIVIGAAAGLLMLGLLIAFAARSFYRLRNSWDPLFPGGGWNRPAAPSR